MKNVFFGMCILGTQLSADVGCMSTRVYDPSSRVHKHTSGVHFVKCSCPCSRYARLDKQGRCDRCHHYRKPMAAIDLE